MAQTDYSAGPFYVTDTGEAIRVRQEASDAVLATMDDGGHPELELIPYAEQLAIARLMAAAPESHEANIEAADFLLATFAQTGNPDAPEGWDDLDAYAVYAKLRAAIAKATGASS